MSDPLLDTIFLFCLGAIWGSFGNVCIYRIPLNKSVVSPRSRCPSCKKPIPFYLNIPIFSWFLLRGKCAYCSVKISWRYPLVEFLVGLSFALLYLRFGWSWTLLEFCIFSFGLIVCSFIDFDHMILPDVFTLGGIVVGLLGAALNPERSFFDAFLGFLVGGGFLYGIAYFYIVFRKIEGMGGGDIKLIGWIGAMLGWQSLPFILLCSSFLGIFLGIFYALRSKEGIKNTAFPFGPCLAGAAMVFMLVDVSRLMAFFFPFSHSY